MYKNVKDAQEHEKIPSWKLILCRLIPLNLSSSAAGYLSNIYIPEILREPIYGLYAYLFKCKLDEHPSLKTYPTFNDFFIRPFLSGKRKIDDSKNSIVSPSDGMILSVGAIKLSEQDDDIYPEQIKGTTYSLESLLGKNAHEELIQSCRRNGNNLHYCTIYLAPGDYHKFHAPVNLKIKDTNRIQGEALSVSPIMLRFLRGLLHLNERIIINTDWKLGKMMIVPVGATNVRSIVLDEGLELKKKGDCLGGFRMGSCVVILLSAPIDCLSWQVKPGDKILLGQSLIRTKDSYRSWLEWLGIF